MNQQTCQHRRTVQFSRLDLPYLVHACEDCGLRFRITAVPPAAFAKVQLPEQRPETQCQAA